MGPGVPAADIAHFRHGRVASWAGCLDEESVVWLDESVEFWYIMNILISCGGTGGHMFPGLSVAAELKSRGHNVTVLLSGRAVENERSAKMIPEGVETCVLPARQLKDPLFYLFLPYYLFRGLRIFRRIRPDVLLAMGSYTSFVPCLTAVLARKPIVLHEANAIPGKAVKALSRFARTICYTFPGVTKFLPAKKHFVDTGVPLRSEMLGIKQHKAGKELTLLVMGGSQGAEAVNRALVEVLSRIVERNPVLGSGLRVIHLAGARNEAEVRELYARHAAGKLAHMVIGFTNEMPKYYSEADLCISRAGASSCFELALGGIPAILIPLPGLAGDHQTANAQYFEEQGAVRVIAQSELATSEALGACLTELLEREEAREALRKAILPLARPDAASRVADSIEAAARKNR